VHYRNGNEMVWEDQTGGGDRDYNDLVFRFELGEPPQPTAKPKISVDDVVVGEGETAAQLTVSLSESSDKEITVTFTTANGSALAGEDYTAISGTIVFAAGETKKTISIFILDDDREEENEQFFLRLGAATKADIDDNEAIITIEDNDIANRPPEITSEPVTTLKLLPISGGNNPSSGVTLSAIIRDFSADHPNFEEGRIAFQPGIVKDELGTDGKPVFNNGFGLITPEQFSQWYNDVPGINLSTIIPFELQETSPGSGIYEFSSNRYFPINNQLLGNEGRTNNYHFTTEINASFTYESGDSLSFTGDDDVWIFIDDKLVVDLGGLHGPLSASVNLDTLDLTVGETYSIDIFHAERQTSESTFVFQTSLELKPQLFDVYVYDVDATDLDQDILTYSLVEAPEGMTIDSVSGLITWKPTNIDPSFKIPVKVRVDDGRGGFDIQEYFIEAETLELGTIQGRKFVDFNGNGVQDSFISESDTLLTPSENLKVTPQFSGFYTAYDLGQVPGLPPSYGGLTLQLDDLNTLLVGGNANTPRGAIYEIEVERGAGNHIVGFKGQAEQFATAAYNDGGITYGPEGILFASRWPVNQIGQTKPGSSITDKIINLNQFGIAPSPGGLTFVPVGMPGEGQMKLVSWRGGQWYDVGILPDGLGTFDIVSATQKATIIGGPEGIAYIPPDSPLFETPSVLVSEWSSGNVVAYEIDNNGDPITSTREILLPGLSGAEGAFIDPLTGDFLFSTFGGGNRIVSIQGFSPTQNPEPGLEGVQVYLDLNNNGVLDLVD
jgi:fibro-slime domain-containing protein